MTVTEFKAARPEFATTANAVVSAALGDAEALAPSSNWTDTGRRTQYVSLLAARALALSPAGRGMELQSDGETVYDRRIAELEAVQVGGGRVL